jgi:hypothetical protein
VSAPSVGTVGVSLLCPAKQGGSQSANRLAKHVSNRMNLGLLCKRACMARMHGAADEKSPGKPLVQKPPPLLQAGPAQRVCWGWQQPHWITSLDTSGNGPTRGGPVPLPHVRPFATCVPAPHQTFFRYVMYSAAMRVRCPLLNVLMQESSV